MGRNRAIKVFDPRMTGQSLNLLTATDTRTPVIVELLKSPWIMRASEIATAPSGLSGKVREHEIEVLWDGTRAAPRSFTLNGRRYPVDAVVQSWALERAWWDPRRRTSRRFFRVLSRGGLYDLAYDRALDRWVLAGVVD
jgi:hypothetical protein